MRIALVHPTYWPEVRRGSERVIHDLGMTLAGRGHEVTLITSHRGRATSTVEDGIAVRRARRPPRLPGLGVWEYHLSNIPNVLRELRRGRFDVVQAFFPPDAWAAVRVQNAGGPPAILTHHGLPTRQYLVARRYRLEMLAATARDAAACTVLSEAASRPFRRYLLRDPQILPPGVLCDALRSEVPRATAPTLICAASLGDPRKRGELLFGAFARVRAGRPTARLQVVRAQDPILSGAEPALPEGAEWVDPGDRAEGFAPLYASAWASVLPSVDEAFGLVLTESLAAGTPVVADRSGAGPEIVDDDRVGRLFARDDVDGLARAIDEALELGARGETAKRCRARAAEYDWGGLVERYEALYESVAGS